MKIKIITRFLLAYIGCGMSLYASAITKDSTVLEKIRLVLGVEQNQDLSAPACREIVLNNFQHMGERKDIIETVIQRGEALLLGVEISYYCNHLFLKWEKQQGDFFVRVDVQVALDQERKAKSVVIAEGKTPIPEKPPTVIMSPPQLRDLPSR